MSCSEASSTVTALHLGTNMNTKITKKKAVVAAAAANQSTGDDEPNILEGTIHLLKSITAQCSNCNAKFDNMDALTEA